MHEFHTHEAARLRSLAAAHHTPVVKARLLAKAVEHEQFAGASVPNCFTNELRALASWHRALAISGDPGDRERRLKPAKQIERRADELGGVIESWRRGHAG